MSVRVRIRALLTVAWMVATALIFFPPRYAAADDQTRQLAGRARLVLKERCFTCHGANGVARKNVFVLDRNRLVQSQTVIPGDPNSLLLKVVESGAMPVGGPELSNEEKEILRNWVERGAPNWDYETTLSGRVFLTEPAILALIRNDLL